MLRMTVQDALNVGFAFLHTETCPKCKRTGQIAVPYDRENDMTKCYCGHEFEMTIRAEFNPFTKKLDYY